MAILPASHFFKQQDQANTVIVDGRKDRGVFPQCGQAVGVRRGYDRAGSQEVANAFHRHEIGYNY